MIFINIFVVKVIGRSTKLSKRAIVGIISFLTEDDPFTFGIDIIGVISLTAPSNLYFFTVSVVCFCINIRRTREALNRDSVVVLIMMLIVLCFFIYIILTGRNHLHTRIYRKRLIVVSIYHLSTASSWLRDGSPLVLVIANINVRIG